MDKRFEIVDLVSGEVLAKVVGKGEADRKFVEIQKKLPKRRLHLRFAVYSW